MTFAAVSVDWSVNRAAGIAAMLLASLSVAAGVLSARGPGLARVVLRRPPRDGRSLHEALALATLAAIAVHVVAFATDGFFGAGIAGAVVPFASPYRALATGAGQVAAYGLAALGLTYYARARLGAARWRSMHRWIVGFWALSVLHTFLAGSDAARVWFQAAMVPPVVAVIIAIGLHWVERVDAATAP